MTKKSEMIFAHSKIKRMANNGSGLGDLKADQSTAINWQLNLQKNS